MQVLFQVTDLRLYAPDLHRTKTVLVLVVVVATINSSRSEPEDFQKPGHELDVRVVSLLSRLARKRIRPRLTLLTGSAGAVGQLTLN